MSYPCPYCGAAASAQTGCPGCGRGPDTDAVEVIRRDAEIAGLAAELATARRTVVDLEARLGHAWDLRHAAAARVNAAVLAARGTGPAPAQSAPAQSAAAASAPAGGNGVRVARAGRPPGR